MALFVLLVLSETWDKTQAIRKMNREKYQGTNSDTRKYMTRYPFSGIVMCAQCGNSYKRRKWSQGYPEPRIVYQCNGYIKNYDDKKSRCQNKNISEDMLTKITCEVINNIYRSRKKIFNTISQIIYKAVKIDDVQEKIDTLNKSKKDIELELNTIISQIAKATSEVEHDILDRKYRNNLNEYTRIEEEISTLKKKQDDANAANIRLGKMKEVLDKEEVTPEMLTKTIVSTFIQNILMVDKHHIVVVIATAKNGSNKEISAHREEIIKLEPLFRFKVYFKIYRISRL